MADGFVAAAGVRLMLTSNVEVSGYGEWADIEDSEFGVGVAARVRFQF